MQKLMKFLRTAWAELKKVTWPGKKEILASTAVVLIVAVILMLYLGTLDFLLSRLVKIIFG